MNETWWVNPGQLDEAQRRVLTEDPETEMLIVGPPGSGKTNILILRANYVRSVAPRLLFLTFTRTLCEFLRAGSNVGRADQIQKQEITTFMAWARRTIRELGGEAPARTGDFEADREAVINGICEIVETENVGCRYDVIFVDEVQDFIGSELKLIRRLAHRINAAGDSRQRIWSHREGIPTITTMVTNLVTLEEHYRIRRKIRTFADQILPPKQGEAPLLEGCNYPEEIRPSSVTPILCRNKVHEYDVCISRIKEQHRYITDEPIGVLCRTEDVRDQFWERLAEDGELTRIAILQRRDEYKAFGPNSLVRVMTVASAKGSEFRAVHLLEAEGYLSDRRELAFTAVTRAKTEVALYHIRPLPGHMIPPSNLLPDLRDIF